MRYSAKRPKVSDAVRAYLGRWESNPAFVLAQMLHQMKDRSGTIKIPGFYDDVQKLSAYERRQMAKLPFHEAKYRKFLGVPQLFGERGFTTDEQRTARPTFEINGAGWSQSWLATT